MAEKFVNYKPACQNFSKIWYATTVGLQDGFQGGGKFCILMIIYLKNFTFMYGEWYVTLMVVSSEINF